MEKLEAKQILENMVSNQGLRDHNQSVAYVMEAIASQLQEDKTAFYIAGLLHDADWEQYPEKHPNVIVAKLIELGEHKIAHAISAHGTEWGVEYTSVMDRALVAVDELSGFICAVAKIRPTGLDGLTTESVLKRFKNKSFASGVDREEINRGVSILGVELQAMIKFIIAVLHQRSSEIGLPEVNGISYVNYLNIPKHENATITIDTPPKEPELRKPKVSQQQIIRTEKRNKLIKKGINPYPGDTFKTNVTAKQINDGNILVNSSVKIAGRITLIRYMGKSAFIDLQEETGTVQLYFKTAGENSLSDGNIELMMNYVDRGDFIGVEGKVFLTKTKVPTIHLSEFILLTKSLRPLPVVKEIIDEKTGEKTKYDEFSNPELRYRQRYVDLIVNPEIRDVFKNRTKIVNVIREAFNCQEFLEVQTPILQPVYGGATARPFVTHHNSLDMKLYLRIANELYLKRLIVGGYTGVYEFSVDFRNEGMGKFHNPEFTQVELYVAYKDYSWMMSLVEETIEKVALEIHGKTKFETFDKVVDFKRPWKRITMKDAIFDASGIDISVLDEKGLIEAAINAGVQIGADIVGRGKVIDEIFGELVEPNLIQPTFITSYPVELSPLAKRSSDNPEFTDRFEGFVCGKEFCNAFSELNDPIDQRKRFEDQLNLANRGDKEAMMLDEDFLRALEYGMPPTAGLGLGIDRLAMVMLNKQSIQEVLFFPQMKPEN